jgi:hypothetical protein
MPFSKDIFDSKTTLARLFAIDYASKKVLFDGFQTPSMEYFAMLIKEKTEDMLHERIREFSIRNISEEDALSEIKDNVERMLGISIPRASFGAIIDGIFDSPQYFLLFDRLEYNIQQENKKRTSMQMPSKTEKEISAINNMIVVAKKENFISFLELLSEQDV